MLLKVLTMKLLDILITKTVKNLNSRYSNPLTKKAFPIYPSTWVEELEVVVSVL